MTIMPWLTALLSCVFAQIHQSAEINTLSPEEKQAGWKLLFNGRDLEGWTTSGDPDAWGVRDGELIIVRPGSGWWLRTDRTYRNFELVLEFNLSEGANSGVGLRGSAYGDPAFTGFEIQIYDSHGDRPAVNGCGAVYNAIAPETQAVRPAGQWNTYRIRCVDDTLDVWLNDEHIHKAQKLDDRGFFRRTDQALPLQDRYPTGYISLQDHGQPVRFRNLKILDLSPDPDPGGYVELFNGKDLDGWFARGGGTWSVGKREIEGGATIGRDGPGHLFSEKTYTNFELRAFVRVNTRGNSGLYFRTIPRPEDPDTWPLGYEAQVDQHDPKNFTGCIYDRAWPEHLDGPITRDNAWFDYRIRAVGDRIQTWINGVPMVDAHLNDFDEGHFALQTHHRGNEVMYRDVRVREITQ